MLDEKGLRTVFAQRLRQLRSVSGMTQMQISHLLNLDRSTYAYYETGKTCPSFDTLMRMSRLFKVSVDYLVGGEDRPRSAVMVRSPVPAMLDGANTFAGLDAREQALLAVYRQMDHDEQQEFFIAAIEKAHGASAPNE